MILLSIFKAILGLIKFCDSVRCVSQIILLAIILRHAFLELYCVLSLGDMHPWESFMFLGIFIDVLPTLSIILGSNFAIPQGASAN